jgi:competence protein ComEC
MSKSYQIYLWKKAPFLRLVLPLVTGILLQYYFSFSIRFIGFSTIFLFLLFIAFTFLPEANRFKLRAVYGVVISLFIVAFGLFLTWQKDIRNSKNWYGNTYSDSSAILITIREPLVEKAKSFKALVSVESVVNKGSQEQTSGKLLLYFSKDSLSSKLNYGDKIIVQKRLQAIKNSGNPAAFDYARYCAFQQIYQQVFLKNNEWILVKKQDQTSFRKVIFSTRDYVIKSLEKNIPGVNESSLAKALLIGYRVDLDKDLVQAYSNVGVVHLIAISGMHLALIYYFLVWIFARIPVIKKSRFLRLVLILGCLWFFSLLTGAPASVLRAAVMFTFIAIGSCFGKQNSIYNSLAISAFLLLCFDPYMLWDVGFQLSYLAVFGIVLCQKYIYNWFYFSNKILNAGWKVASVSLAAQVFTLPICIYYFHQFPFLFLLSNLIAIPLSTVALWGAVAVVAVSPFPFAALCLGKALWFFLWLLNHSVLVINSIPFSLWKGLSISPFETILLYFIFTALLYWLIKKNKQAFKIALVFSSVFMVTRAYKSGESFHQKKMVVYNISQHSAIDLIDGNSSFFISDSTVFNDNLLMNYNVKPARTAFLVNNSFSSSPFIYHENKFYQFYNKRFLLIDSSIKYYRGAKKMKLDFIVISKNAPVKISDIASNFDCGNYIFDASNSLWKIEKWKKECEELHLHSHSVSLQGAFVTDL